MHGQERTICWWLSAPASFLINHLQSVFLYYGLASLDSHCGVKVSVKKKHLQNHLQHQEHHPWCYGDQINQTWSFLQTVLLVFIPVEFIPTRNFTRCMLMEMSNVLHSFWNVRGSLNQIKTWGNWHTHVRHLPGMVIITSPTKQNYLISPRRWGCF